MTLLDNKAGQLDKADLRTFLGTVTAVGYKLQQSNKDSDVEN